MCFALSRGSLDEFSRRGLRVKFGGRRDATG
jgi:hypothetical protein